MTILAFDQATRITGYCVMEDGLCKRFGKIDYSKMDYDTDYRLEKMISSMIELIRFEKPDLVVFEYVEMMQSPKTVIKLSEMVGGIRTYCIYNGVNYRLYLPTTWRSLLGFKQGAGVKRPELKKQAIEFADKLAGVKQEDTAEAICIACATWKDLTGKEDWR